MPALSSRARRTVGVLALTLAVALVAAAPALSASAAPSGDIGWVRLAHLSPDTQAVDVRVTSPDGTVVYELDNVPYGAVSPYQQLPGGTYAVTMVPKGKGWGVEPLLSSAMRVKSAEAVTVAAFGSNKNLKLHPFTDDLTVPQPGTARVRLIQASTKVKTVTVATTTGMAVAQGAKSGSATGYTAVPAGAWTLALSGKGTRTATSDVDLPGSSVNTLLVLDSTTGLKLRPVLDSAAVAAAPIGGVNTGGGWLAEHPQLLHAAP